MGDVYEGVHELIGKRLAIKCMHAEFAKNQEAVERFKREAQSATSVGNKHIVDVSDLGVLPDGSPFMVMEFLDGCEFADLIENQFPLPVGRVCRIVTQVLEALEAAHQKGVVHRDMKPENIFIVNRDANPDFVKVLDFGISLMKEKAEEESARMTKTGIAMGTPHYMSPEQARGTRDVDHRTDIYSCGVILYEALLGDTPFDASSLAVLMTQILTENPQSIREVRPDVPIALEELILRSMSKNPHARPQDAKQFAEELKPYLEFDTEASVLERNQNAKKIELATALVPPLPPSDAMLAQDPSLAGSHASVHAASSSTLKTFGFISIGVLALAGAMAIPFLKSKNPAHPLASTEMPSQTPLVKKKSDKNIVAVKEVEVVISASPSAAIIFINGKRYPNPLAVSMPKTSEPVEVQIALDGYKTRNEVAVFDRNHKQHFELVKIEPPKKKTTERKNRSKKNNKKKVEKKSTKPSPETRSKFRDTF